MATEQQVTTGKEESPQAEREGGGKVEVTGPTGREHLHFGELARPLAFMRRLGEEMDRLMGQMFGPIVGRGERLLSRPGELTWWPELEIFERGGKLVVRADVPGLRKEDVNVEVRDDDLIISGERRTESERKEGRFYRSERSYGSFCRTVPLPKGAKPDTASARFENGVLEVEIEVPSFGESQGRRIEVREGPLQ